VRADEPFRISLEQSGVAGPLEIELEPVRQEPTDECALPRLPRAEDEDDREDSQEPAERITRVPGYVLHNADRDARPGAIHGIAKVHARTARMTSRRAPAGAGANRGISASRFRS